jgi:hypothetical protein
MDENKLPPRDAAQNRITELAQLDSAARVAESRSLVFQSRAHANPNDPDAQRLADEAAAEATEASAKLRELQDNPLAVDPEGTAPGLADRLGNFAANVEVANAGGIGVEGSNSNVDTGAPAASADEAGVLADPRPSVIMGPGGKALEAPAGEGAGEGDDGLFGEGAEGGEPRAAKKAKGGRKPS